MSGQWPPGWDDPDDVPGAADQQDAEAEAGLSEVAAYLASVPAPVMPGSVEARISAALAVEAAARSGIVAPASGAAKGGGVTQLDEPVKSDEPVKTGGAVGARVLGPAPGRARVRRGVSGRRREREMAKIFKPGRQRDAREVIGKFVLGPLAVCLLVVIIALGLSHGGSSSSSSSAGGLSRVVPAARPASSAPAASNGFGKSSAASGAVAAPASSAAASAPLPEAGGPGFFYVVTHSGTSYQPTTLARQARALVLAVRARESVPSGASTATSAGSAASATSAPQTFAPQTLSVQLRECILKVTGGEMPVVVDRATYQGTPAYVIASTSHVWVVGLGCTAAKPQVIASEALAG